MHESGVDLGFDLLEDLEAQLPTCYTLKSKPLIKVELGPNSFQLMGSQVKIKPDPDAIMSTSLPSTSGGFLMRTNFKQQLQKEHLMQLDKTQTALKQMSVESNGLSIPREKSPVHKLPTDVPPGILKVKTKLENPTSYHLKQQQQKQLKEYYNTQQQLSYGNQQIAESSYLSTLTSPSSPDLADSSVASSGVDSVLDFFGTLDATGQDLMFGDGLPFSSTLPTNTGLLDLYAPDMVTDQSYDKHTALQISASCPANVKRDVPTSPCNPNLLAKDRQKKDNHNMIERRRRYNINDRIRELGTLIPKTDSSDSKQNKGTILKSSVDYIRRLKKERDRMKDVEIENKTLQETNRQLSLKVQELELILRASSIATQLPSLNLQSNLSSLANLQLASLLSSDKSNSQSSSAMTSPVQASNTLAMDRSSPDSVDESSHLSSIRSAISEDDCVIMDDE